MEKCFVALLWLGCQFSVAHRSRRLRRTASLRRQIPSRSHSFTMYWPQGAYSCCNARRQSKNTRNLTLHLDFRVISEHTRLITVNAVFKKSEFSFEQSSISCETSNRSCFCSIVCSVGTNFADILLTPKSSVRIECTEPMRIPTSSEISRLVIRRFWLKPEFI